MSPTYSVPFSDVNGETDPGGAWPVAQVAPDVAVGPRYWRGVRPYRQIAAGPTGKVIEVGELEYEFLRHFDGKTTVQSARLATELKLGRGLTEKGALHLYSYFFAQDFLTVRGAARGPIDGGSPAAPAAENVAQHLRFFRKAIGIRASWSPAAAWLTIPFALFAGVAVLVILTGDRLVVGVGTLWRDPALIVAVILWSLLVSLLHELGHGFVFVWVSGRSSQIGVARVGGAFLLRTTTAGLMIQGSRHAHALVCLAGPAMSALLIAAPAAVWFTSPNGSLIHGLSACLILFESIRLGINLALFPNSDGTRALEAAAVTDSIWSGRRTYRQALRVEGPSALPSTAVPLVLRRTYSLLPILAIVQAIATVAVLAAVTRNIW
jgi:hypothetical protein